MGVRINKVCEFKEVENPYPENELPDLDYGGCKHLGYAGNREGYKTAQYYFRCFCGNIFRDEATNVIKVVNPSCGCSKDKRIWKESSSLFELHMNTWNPDTEDPLIKKLPVFKGIVGREKVAGYSLVDQDVFNVWSKIMWVFDLNNYVVANYSKGNCRRLGIDLPDNRESLTLHLHRCVLGLGHTSEYKGDHINGNKTDNRTCNLRLATNAENNYNKSVINNVNGFLGVKKMPEYYHHNNGSVYKRKKIWVAAIEYKGKYISKYFHTKEEASWYRDLMSVDLHGEFATLNHPENLEEYKSKLHTLHYK